MSRVTNEQIYQTALRQSAIDCGCRPEDFLAGENRIVPSRPHERARRYLTLPFSCNLVSYGGGVVASVSGGLEGVVADYLNRFDPVHCFETPNLHVLNDALAPHGQQICFMAEYFLPDLRALRPLPSPLPTRLLGPEELAPLYLPQWSNALCEKRRELDVLAVGAYDGAELVGLAGCSADCEEMWQIGIDVLATAAGGSPPPSPAGWRWRPCGGARCPFTARRGPTSARCEMPSRAGFALPGWR